MNFFEFYGLPVSFLLDEQLLRQRYLAISKATHPDYYATRSVAEQQAALQQATLNTKAYQTLADFDARMRYVLELYQQLTAEDKPKMPSEFLADILEINETIEDLKQHPDAQRKQQLEVELSQMAQRLYDDIYPVLVTLDREGPQPQLLERVKDYYLKKRYILRLRQSLDSFGGTQINEPG